MLDWHGSGQSVTEMSHRGKEFTEIAARAEADLRTLLGVPDGYQVLFLQGGASLQFEMIPLNLLRGKPTVDYVHTGEWAKKAIAAVRKLGRAEVNVAASAGGPLVHLRAGPGRPGDSVRGRGVRALHGQRDDRRGRVLARCPTSARCR